MCPSSRLNHCAIHEYPALHCYSRPCGNNRRNVVKLCFPGPVLITYFRQGQLLEFPVSAVSFGQLRDKLIGCFKGCSSWQGWIDRYLRIPRRRITHLFLGKAELVLLPLVVRVIN